MDELSRLARLAGAGDHDALDLFVRSTYDQVWTYCSAFISPGRADDLAQDTYLRAVQSIASYRRESAAKTWLLGIARHVCLDELRSRYRHARNHDAIRRQEQPVGADASENVVVADLLGRLETSRREAFVLTQVLGLPYQEAARVAGCPVGTIRSRVARAREDLLEHLGRRDGAPDATPLPRPPAAGSSTAP